MPVSRNQEEAEMDATTVAVDVAKTVFELAGADPAWRIVFRRRVNRPAFAQFLATSAPLQVVMEACGTAHYWGRVAQQHGHRVTLLPAAYVRPYVRRSKTDRADAEALLEAVRSGMVPPVAVKTIAQQALVALHRVREQWMTTRTARINALRGLLREHGILLPAGARAAVTAVPAVLEDADLPLPLYLRQTLAAVQEEIRDVERRLADLEKQLAALAAADPVITQLRTIPGVGLLTATALVGSVGHIHAFRRARQFASWLGLTPREYSSGHRRRLGSISKRGDVYLRCLLTHGGRAVLHGAQRRAREGQALSRLQQWALTLQTRRGHNKAAIALANKLARIVWAVWHRDVPFAAQDAAAA
jgi:transposase